MSEAYVDPLLIGIDPALFSRKGYLCLVCRSDASPELPAAVIQQYYESASFDIVPSLSAVLIRAYSEWPDALDQLPLAVVTQGLELQAVGSENAVVWLMRGGQMREIFCPLAGPKPWSMRLDDLGGEGLHAMQWRLATGDALVMTNQDALARLTPTRARRILAKGGGLTRTAEAIARSARSTTKSDKRSLMPPVTVLRTRGYSAVPELTSSGGAPSTRPIKPEPEVPRGRSPIWPALGIAVLAIALAFWIKRPDISRESIDSMIKLVMTRAPSATPGPESVQGDSQASGAMPGSPTASAESKPTATVHAPAALPEPATSASEGTVATPVETPSIAPTPNLRSPEPDAMVRGPELTLLWEWPGELAADEYFDVRMWVMGADPKSIAWTQEPTYVERTPSDGWHSWTVRIVRGGDGVIQEVLAEGLISNFRWNPAPIEDKPTTVPPTRLAPDDRPTRVPPSSGGE